MSMRKDESGYEHSLGSEDELFFGDDEGTRAEAASASEEVDDESEALTRAVRQSSGRRRRRRNYAALRLIERRNEDRWLHEQIADLGREFRFEDSRFDR